MNKKEQDYFTQMFEEKIKSIYNKLIDQEKVLNNILIRVKETNGRVSKLEQWQLLMRGKIWGVVITCTVIASIVTTILGFYLKT